MRTPIIVMALILIGFAVVGTIERNSVQYETICIREHCVEVVTNN